MSEFLDQVVPTGERLPPTIWLSLRLRPERLDCSVRFCELGETRSQQLWETRVSRPEGKTLAECVEAGMYRFARAGADGLLVPPGWDSLT